MSVKLRMRRIGRKKIPVYSIVATDSRNARDGRYIEDLGRYYPLREPAEVKLDEERALHWLENGAQPSDTVHSILHRRGILLQHHLKKKGEAPDEIQESVEEFRERMAAEGKDLKMVVEPQGEDALQKERDRAEELDEEARLRSQATPIPVDDAVVQEEESATDADAAEESDASDGEAPAPDAESTEASADEGEEAEGDDEPDAKDE
ncbi:MAG: 30S ribosomal protein S16 [Salinibacter sp.]